MTSTFYPEDGFDTGNFAGKPLIVPSVSLGNLPQLAVDLLIASLSLKRVGWIGDGSTVAPFGGVDADGQAITGGMTVYGRAENDMFFVQQRSPTLKTHKDEHLDKLTEFIKTSQFEVVLVLTSMDAANQDDAQLSTPLQSISPPNTSILTSHPLLTRLRLLPAFSLILDAVLATTSGLPTGVSSLADPVSPYPPFLPSAGLTRRLLARLQVESVPHGCLAAWCVEGDNRGDAWGMAGEVGRLLGIDDLQIVEPESWKGLFGGVGGWSGGQGENSEIYG